MLSCLHGVMEAAAEQEPEAGLSDSRECERKSQSTHTSIDIKHEQREGLGRTRLKPVGKKKTHVKGEIFKANFREHLFSSVHFLYLLILSHFTESSCQWHLLMQAPCPFHVVFKNDFRCHCQCPSSFISLTGREQKVGSLQVVADDCDVCVCVFVCTM